jgi:hypothetical protein
MSDHDSNSSGYDGDDPYMRPPIHSKSHPRIQHRSISKSLKSKGKVISSRKNAVYSGTVGMLSSSSSSSEEDADADGGVDANESNPSSSDEVEILPHNSSASGTHTRGSKRQKLNNGTASLTAAASNIANAAAASSVRVAAISVSSDSSSPSRNSSPSPIRSRTKQNTSRRKKKAASTSNSSKASTSNKKDKRSSRAEYLEPTIVDGEPAWTADFIVAEDRDEKGRPVFLIKWKGFAHADDTWEPPSSISTCTFLLAQWKSEKESIQSAMRAKQIDIAPGTRIPLRFPIIARSMKHSMQNRSYASDCAWNERQVEKAKLSAQKEKEKEKRNKSLALQKRIKEAKRQRQQEAKEEAARLELIARKEREERERIAAENAREIARRARQAELESTEPYYFVTADDSILMAAMNSDEEEEWGADESPAPIHIASNNNNNENKRKHQSSSGTKRSNEMSDGGSGVSKRKSTSRSKDAYIAPEEWSDEDLSYIGDGKGEDAKLKSYFAKIGVHEVDAILDIRPIDHAQLEIEMKEFQHDNSAVDGPSAIPSIGAAASSSSLIVPLPIVPPRLGNEFEYRIRWKGSDRLLTWEKESNLVGCQAKLDAFIRNATKNKFLTLQQIKNAAEATKIKMLNKDGTGDALYATHTASKRNGRK